MASPGGFFSQTLPYTGITVMQLVYALAVLIIGWIVAGAIGAIFSRKLKKTKLPALAADFLASFLGALLHVAVVLLAAGALGISLGSVVVGLSAVIGLILGFGMQDTLTNVAAGVWIATLRPIDTDEVVEVAGKTGKVRAVKLMATELLTPDNKYITIPNKLVWGDSVTNYTRMPTRRVDVAVGIGYASDLQRAVRVATELMRGHSLVLDDPAPAVVTTELADSSVNLVLRAWAKTEDYWTVMGDLTNGILEAFKREGVEIPFPQLDVHVTQQ
jgi:small-conductance mechanosensitive channel